MAISVNFSNVTVPTSIPESVHNQPTPPFEQHVEDIASLRERLAPFQQYKNILLVGNGGSIWSLMCYWQALGNKVNGKTIIPLTDMEPDYLAIIKAKYTAADSLVVVVSKSGSTVGAVENIFTFWDYPMLFVTDPEGPIAQLAAVKQGTVIQHPTVGGRYSGFSSSAYVPAILLGLPVEAIEAGARAGYDQFRIVEENNPALQAALILNQLEEEGYTSIFMPIYSNFLQTFGMQVTQLFHESFGKEGKGMTVLAVQAPESQHHTNQRFFGGPKDMVGLFLHVNQQANDSLSITVPAGTSDITLRSGKMGDIDGLSLADAFHAEYVGTFTNASKQGIPLIDVAVSSVTGETVGELMAFWHYVTVFSSLLRGVDPYNQPEVEASKVISFEERLKARQALK